MALGVLTFFAPTNGKGLPAKEPGKTNQEKI